MDGVMWVMASSSDLTIPVWYQTAAAQAVVWCQILFCAKGLCHL